MNYEPKLIVTFTYSFFCQDDGWEEGEDEDEYEDDDDGDEGPLSEQALLAQLSDYSSGLIYPGKKTKKSLLLQSVLIKSDFVSLFR